MAKQKPTGKTLNSFSQLGEATGVVNKTSARGQKGGRKTPKTTAKKVVDRRTANQLAGAVVASAAVITNIQKELSKLREEMATMWKHVNPNSGDCERLYAKRINERKALLDADTKLLAKLNGQNPTTLTDQQVASLLEETTSCITRIGKHAKFLAEIAAEEAAILPMLSRQGKLLAQLRVAQDMHTQNKDAHARALEIESAKLVLIEKPLEIPALPNREITLSQPDTKSTAREKLAALRALYTNKEVATEEVATDVIETL